MAENTNLSLTLEAWAQIVIEKWKLKIAALDIGRTGDLVRSFHHQVIADANGSPEKIIFAFNYYGKFVDMGVGSGVTLGATERFNRKPKVWHSKILYAQIARLKEIMVEKYQAKAMDVLVNENWDGKTSSGGSSSKRQPQGQGRGYTSRQYDYYHGN